MTAAAGPRDGSGYPPEVEAALRRARKLEWWSILWIATVLGLMSLVAGETQIMRTALIEDALSLLPPILFLVTVRLEGRGPTRRFPHGLHRTASLAFFAAAAALLAFGTIPLHGAVMTLVRAEHPTIGSFRAWGQEVWTGWAMIAILAYSVVPPVILGRLKRRPAEVLHDKVLVTDAEMNAADWQTGLAGILGILGIAWGLWWADAVAAALISLSILWDGVAALRAATAELVDGAPRALRSNALDDDALLLMERARALGGRLQLRETGRLVTGVLESRDPADLGRLQAGAAWRVRDLSWRPLPERAAPPAGTARSDGR